MANTARPKTSEELIKDLASLVPSFATDWADDRQGEVNAPTFHSVIQTFAYTLGIACETLGDSKLKALGHYLNQCVSVDDILENAVSTCLLEHLHQISALDALWPYLSPRARSECHA